MSGIETSGTAFYIVGLTTDPASSAGAAGPTVAVLPWGDLFEDWLDPLGVGLDALPSFTGSWMFGWADALRRAGTRTAIVAVTTRVPRLLRLEHAPTGAVLYLLPPAAPYRRIAPHMARSGLEGRRDAGSLAAAALAQAAPFLATPPLALRRVLQAERAVAVVCQEYETPRFDVAVAIGRSLRRPVFATFQGGDYRSSRLEGLVRPVGIRGAAGFVVATSSEAERLRDRYGVSPARIARIFNPVDTEFWRPGGRSAARAALGLADDAGVVVWHGQLHPRKGLDVLVQAWRLLRADRPGRDLRLVLVGAGEQRGRDLVGDAAQVELVEEWVVDRTRIRRHLAAADVYAFPSRHEGFPVAPLEAMACGLPVVAADAQGVRDIFAGGERHGGVVVPRDDAGRLATELGRLLDDVERRERLGRAARRRIEEAFAPAATGRRLRAFLLDRTTIR